MGCHSGKGDLLMMQGPLALNWRSRKWGVLPRLENAELSGTQPAERRAIRIVDRAAHPRARPAGLGVCESAYTRLCRVEHEGAARRADAAAA